MRRRLKADDLDGFLKAYEQYMLKVAYEPAAIPITQVDFPAALRRTLERGTVATETLVTLSRLVLHGHLLLIDDDLRELVNHHIAAAREHIARTTTNLRLEQLPIYVRPEKKSPDAYRVNRGSMSTDGAFQMKRISITSRFSIRCWSASDAFDFRRNLCASNQEREFLRAIRQYFPSMQAYPNIPLHSFVNLDDLGPCIPISFREFALKSRVDILVCTCDEDPVAGFELDSSWHDNGDAARRDDIKNKLFQLAGLPLFRIRHIDPSAVRAEDFYDLLSAEPDLATLRPRRLRPRRSHDGLVPENAETTHSW